MKKLTAKGPVLAASLVWNGKRCGRPGCRCERGEKHMACYLTYKEQGKTRTVYVPVDLVKEVRKWIEEHRRLKRLSQEISALSIAMVRTHVRARTRRAGGAAVFGRVAVSGLGYVGPFPIRNTAGSR